MGIPVHAAGLDIDGDPGPASLGYRTSAGIATDADRIQREQERANGTGIRITCMDGDGSKLK